MNLDVDWVQGRSMHPHEKVILRWQWRQVHILANHYSLPGMRIIEGSAYIAPTNCFDNLLPVNTDGFHCEELVGDASDNREDRSRAQSLARCIQVEFMTGSNTEDKQAN